MNARSPRPGVSSHQPPEGEAPVAESWQKFTTDDTRAVPWFPRVKSRQPKDLHLSGRERKSRDAVDKRSGAVFFALRFLVFFLSAAVHLSAEPFLSNHQSSSRGRMGVGRPTHSPGAGCRTGTTPSRRRASGRSPQARRTAGPGIGGNRWKAFWITLDSPPVYWRGAHAPSNTDPSNAERPRG